MQKSKHSIDELSKRFEFIMTQVLGKNKKFNLSVSGGITPLPLFKEMGYNFRYNKNWKLMAHQTNIFWVDERPVPIDHPDSNVGNMMSFFENTSLNLHPFRGDAHDLSKEAERYESLIREMIKQVDESRIIGFDLTLLGMGEDGHIASLFPCTSGISETEKWVISNYIPQLDQIRLTMTFPLLLLSEHIWILYSGKKKKELVQQVLAGKQEQLPVSYLLEQYKNKNIEFIEI